MFASQINPSVLILEIGCGTGQATKGFVDLGFDNVTCVELGERLAEFTRQKFKDKPKVNIINSPFEQWESGKTFDLAISATAFHFINPQPPGYRKVFDLLNTNGTIAFFWTVHVPAFDDVHNRIRESYRQIAPALDDSSAPRVDEIIEERSALTVQNGLFEDLSVKSYRWNDTYSAHDYISLLNTNSRHRILRDDVKAELFKNIESTIEQHGGTIIKPQAVILFLARKKVG